MGMEFSRFGFYLALTFFMIIVLVVRVADYGTSQLQIGKDITNAKNLQQTQGKIFLRFKDDSTKSYLRAR